MERKGKTRKWLYRTGVALLVMLGLGLVFNQQIENLLLDIFGGSSIRSAQNLTPKQMQHNAKTASGNYSAAAVKPLSFGSVARSVSVPRYAIGLVSVPSVGITLPIYKGMSNSVLAYGAGTMKPGETMGQGNYALAGHHVSTGRLFSRLSYAHAGHNIYLTDKKYVYTYRIDSVRHVDKTQGQVIDDVPGKQLVTLVTCISAHYMERTREIVQGHLVSKTDATKSELSAHF